MAASNTSQTSFPMECCLIYDGDHAAAGLELAQPARSALRQSLAVPVDHLLARPEVWWAGLAGTGLHHRYREAQGRLAGCGEDAWQCLALALSCSVPLTAGAPQGGWALIPGVCGPRGSARWRLNAAQQCVEAVPEAEGFRDLDRDALGTSSQEEQLWRRGVCRDDWRLEVLDVPLAVPPTELAEAAVAKAALLRRLGLPLGRYPLRWDGPERREVTLPGELLSAVRLLLCMDWELYWHQYTAAPAIPVVSHWNELKVFKYLRTHLGDSLRALEALLAAGPVTPVAAAAPDSGGGGQLAGDAAVRLCLGRQADLARAALRQVQTLSDAFSPLSAPCSIKPESPILQAFHRWFRESSGKDPAVQACDFAEDAGCGRGLRTARPVGAGQPVVQVPWDVVLSIDTALRSRHAPVYLQSGLEEDEVLMVFLLHEMHDPDSKWAPYFAVLPESHQSPLLWSAEELLELEGSSLLEDVVQCRAALRESYDRRFPALSLQFPDTFPEAVFRYDAWVLARCIFDSRCFKINVDGKAHNCLVPLADMVNHYSDGNVSYRRFDQATRCVTLDCLRDLPAGQEVRMNYGLLQNWESLMQYAMVDLDGPDDSVHFDLDAEDFATDAETAQHVLRLLTDSGLSLEHFLPHSGAPAPQLLAVLRCLSMTPEDVRQATVEGWDPAVCRPLNVRNEQQAVEALQQVVEAMLQAYPTTLEEDEGCLAGDAAPPPFSPAGLALRFRVSQKRILRRARAHAAALSTAAATAAACT